MYEPISGTTSASARRGMTGLLLVDRPGLPPRVVPVNRDLLLGRDDSSDIVLPSNLVSRRHARVWPHDDGVAVEDLGSRNGTRVNGRRVASVVQLQDGDTLTLGDVQVQFHLPGVHLAPRSPDPAEAKADRQPGSGGLHPAEPPILEGSTDRGVKTLALAVLESLVGTAFSQAIGTGLAGTYALAAITPLLGTVFALRKDGRMRLSAVVVVTAIAVALTVAGVTVADATLGRSVFPWSSSDRTFIPPPDGGSDNATKLLMPKLVGENNVTAVQLLARYGFQPQNILVVDTPSSHESFGKVVRTDPRAGAKVPDDAIVRIYIGVGGPP